MGRRQRCDHDTELFIKNSDCFKLYQTRLIEMALSQFEWHGLPETCNRWYFEKALLNGSAAMYKPEGCDFWVSTGWVLQGDLNIYGLPTKIRGVGANGKTSMIKVDENAWEICYDNMMHYSMMDKINFYATWLAEITLTHQSNLQNQINPIVVLSNTPGDTLSFKNFFKRVFAYDKVINVSKTFDVENVKTLDLQSPYVKELLEDLKVVWAEALTMLGISYQSTKRERMLNGEIAMDRQADFISLNNRLLNRVEFCNLMNKKYNFNLDVNLSSDRNLEEEMNKFDDLAMQALDATSNGDTDREPGEGNEKEDDKDE